MIYGSVCSGIEAASFAFKPLRWKAAWLSEIEPVPCSILAHHYPDVPNLGDMTKLHEREEFHKQQINLLIGGTPCQSFSVAGLREGLADPRGNLTLTFLKIAAEKKPEFIVWENVPGILSDETGALKSLLDGLEDLGYIIDIDILDARFFGIPQRRRRVFICAQSVESLLSQTTPSSALTIAQCLTEILHSILVGTSTRYGRGPANSKLQGLSVDGMKRRMRLFGLAGEKNNYKKLQKILIEVLRKFPAGAVNSELPGGASEADFTADDRLTAFGKAQGQFSLTEESLKSALDEAYEVMKLFITSTSTSSTTQQQIFTCSKAVLLIGKLIVRLRRSCPSSWSAGCSFLTAVKEYTDYARQADGDLFARLDGILPWIDFIREAELANDFEFDIGDREHSASILFESSSSPWNPSTSPKKRQGVANVHQGPVGGGGQPGVPEIAETLRSGSTNPASHGKLNGTDRMTLIPTVMAHGQANVEIHEDESPSLTCNHEAPIVARTLHGKGFDASENETGMGTPLVAVSESHEEPLVLILEDQGGSVMNINDSGVVGTLRSQTHGHEPLVFEARVARNGRGAPDEVVPPLKAQSGKDDRGDGAPLVAFSTKLDNTQNNQAGKFYEEYTPAVSKNSAGVVTTVLDEYNQSGSEEVCYPLRTASGDGIPKINSTIQGSASVRRLTPKECERLMGFPDNWTLVKHGKKWTSDGSRYKALGNSIVVPVLSWIGRRIQLVDDLLKDRRV